MSVILAKTRFGLVEGIREEEVTVWKGIPYAAPQLTRSDFVRHKNQNHGQG